MIRVTAVAEVAFGLVRFPVRLVAANVVPGQSVRGVKGVEIRSFAPVATLDPSFVGRTYHVEPGPGGDRACELFAIALQRRACVAVGTMSNGRGAAIASVDGRLMLAVLAYPDELRSVPRRIGITIAAAELELADRLISQGWIGRVELAGRPVSPKRSNVIDLFEVMKRPLDRKVG